MANGVSARRYSAVAILLHWASALAVLVLIGLGLTMTHAVLAPLRQFQLYQWHKSVGLTVLALTLLRLGWRLAHRPPPLPATLPARERAGAHAAHALLYGLLLGLPLAQAPQGRLGFGEARGAVVGRLEAAVPQAPHRFRRGGDPAAALELAEPVRSAGDVVTQPGDLLGEHRPGFPHGVAVGFHHGDGFGGFGGEVLAATGKGRGRAVFQIGDPGQGRLKTLALGLVLGDCDCERPLGPFDAGCGIPDMLVEHEQRAPVDRLLFGGVNSAAYQCPKRLDHG